MSKRKMNYFVCTEPRPDKNGFTFITLITMISILALTLPFLSYAMQTAKPDSNFDDLAMNEFYRFIRDEIIRSQSVYVANNKLHFKQEINEITEDFDIATISLYYNVVRRQVNGQGHEIYLRDVAEMIFKEYPYGLKIITTDMEGKTYEKIFTLYNAK